MGSKENFSKEKAVEETLPEGQLHIIIKTKMTSEYYEKLEVKLAEFMKNEGLVGFIEDDVTGNTSTFGQSG